MMHSFAAEPATLIYLATGAVGFGWAKLTRTRRRKSTMMLFTQRRSRMAMDSLDLL